MYFFTLAYLRWVNSKAKLQLCSTLSDQEKAWSCAPCQRQLGSIQVGFLRDELSQRLHEVLVVTKPAQDKEPLWGSLKWSGLLAVQGTAFIQTNLWYGGVVSCVHEQICVAVTSVPDRSVLCAEVSEGWKHLGVLGGTPCTDPGIGVGPLLLAPLSSIPHLLRNSCTLQAGFGEALYWWDAATLPCLWNNGFGFLFFYFSAVFHVLIYIYFIKPLCLMQFFVRRASASSITGEDCQTVVNLHVSAQLPELPQMGFYTLQLLGN